jgi:hypothetical protein
MNVKHNRTIIQRRLSISQLEYCQQVEKGAYVWLNRYFFHVPEVIKLSSYSEMWWKWWVNQWDIRDNYFVCTNRFTETNASILKQSYHEIHNINKILVRPNRLVIKEVGKLIKEYTKQTHE